MRVGLPTELMGCPVKSIDGHGTLQKYRGSGTRYFAKISTAVLVLSNQKYSGTFLKNKKEKNWTDWACLQDCKSSL